MYCFTVPRFSAIVKSAFTQLTKRFRMLDVLFFLWTKNACQQISIENLRKLKRKSNLLRNQTNLDEKYKLKNMARMDLENNLKSEKLNRKFCFTFYLREMAISK